MDRRRRAKSRVLRVFLMRAVEKCSRAKSIPDAEQAVILFGERLAGHMVPHYFGMTENHAPLKD